MSDYMVARIDEIDEIDDGRVPWRPVRHHFGITSFGVNAWTGACRGRPDHQRARRVGAGRRRGALPRPAGRAPVRARRRAGGRARRHARLRPPRREANGVRRGARDDDHRARRHAGKGVRADGWELWAPLHPLYEAGEYAEAADRGRELIEAHPSMPACSTTSPAARASPGGRPTRSSTCGTRSSCRSGSASFAAGDSDFDPIRDEPGVQGADGLRRQRRGSVSLREWTGLAPAPGDRVTGPLSLLGRHDEMLTAPSHLSVGRPAQLTCRPRFERTPPGVHDGPTSRRRFGRSARRAPGSGRSHPIRSTRRCPGVRHAVHSATA